MRWGSSDVCTGDQWNQYSCRAQRAIHHCDWVRPRLRHFTAETHFKDAQTDIKYLLLSWLRFVLWLQRRPGLWSCSTWWPGTAEASVHWQGRLTLETGASIFCLPVLQRRRVSRPCVVCVDQTHFTAPGICQTQHPRVIAHIWRGHVSDSPNSLSLSKEQVQTGIQILSWNGYTDMSNICLWMRSSVTHKKKENTQTHRTDEGRGELPVIMPSLWAPRCPACPAETRADGSFISASFEQVLHHIRTAKNMSEKNEIFSKEINKRAGIKGVHGPYRQVKSSERDVISLSVLLSKLQVCHCLSICLYFLPGVKTQFQAYDMASAGEHALTSLKMYHI